MEFDFNAMLNAMQLASLEKENPSVAKAVRVLMKKGFSVTESIALLLEIGAIFQEGEADE